MSDDFWMGLIVLGVLVTAIGVPSFCIYLVVRIFRKKHYSEVIDHILDDGESTEKSFENERH